MSLLVALQTSPALLVGMIVLISLAVGSFLNVVIHRMPSMLMRDWRHQALEVLGEWADEKDAPPVARELKVPVRALTGHIETLGRYNLAVPRSACPACGSGISALQNIPLASWLWLRGHCAACGNRISLRYPVVEVLTGALSGYVAWRFGFSLNTVAGLLFVWTMIALSFIDLDTTFLPDDITQPLLWTGILLSVVGVFTTLPSSVIGAVAGYLVLWIVSKSWNALRNVDSMGHGDFKLLAAIGAWLGWEMLPQTILVSSFMGALVGLSLMIAGRGDLSTKIPFGPYLAAGGVLAMLHGEAINQYYLRLL